MSGKPRYIHFRLPRDPDLQGTNRILAGLALISGYDQNADFACDHDQLWFGDYERVPNHEHPILESWGWFESEDSWSHFV